MLNTFEAEQNSKRLAEAGRMLVEAEAIRELAKMYSGTSEELLYSPASLGKSLFEFAENRKKHAISMISIAVSLDSDDVLRLT